AQLVETFSNGNFTTNPVWVGNTADFIVNSNLQLQSNNTVVNSSYYLSTGNSMANTAQWSFWVKIDFNPSSTNYVDVYLTASASDLSVNSTYGYFVRIGGTNDEICLYRKSNTGAITKIIDGVDNVLNNSSNTMRILVTRDGSNLWTLMRDMSGTGTTYTSEGSVTDATYTTTSFFGFFVKQSTASFFQKHYFDDIEIKTFVPDVTPPQIQSTVTTSSNKVDVLFNEPIDPVSSQSIANYSANNGLGLPSSAVIDAGNSALVHLTFATNFANGKIYTLSVSGVKDVAGNAMTTATSDFSFYTPQRYDVVIDELFPDPNPQVGLPLYKFLELKNTSAFPINLQNWKITDGSSSAVLPAFNLMPGGYVIICATSSAASFATYGPTLGVTGFPSMNIGGGTITLKSPSNATIHAVTYDLTSYKNDLKKDGGWSLEMIDTKNACAGSLNWKASTDPTGGTPGKKNSVDGTITDGASPKLLRAFFTAPNIVTVVYDKPMDSAKVSTVANYTLDNSLTIISAEGVGPFFNKVNLTINNTLAPKIVYNLKVNNISDCSGNALSSNTAKFGLGEVPDSADLVINEILFNPLPGGVDYVELYNNSNKIIDLSKTYLANRSTAGAVASMQQISTESVLLFPNEFVLLTTNTDAVKSQYITTNPNAFLQMSSFPSYSNTSGNVLVLNNQGIILDEVNYLDKWHFALIANTQGVSLERIDYNAPSVKSNFHSAATSAGYGTPGYKNSQYKAADNLPGEITVTPEVFSPDNDGIDDFLTIYYQFPIIGYVANITIFDASGRAVRFLQKNSLSGINGYYRWDGLNDKGAKLPQGIYIVYTEIFNRDGKTKKFKNTVVLARKY
ncbi:MAG: lamin tail domain-containing protein, partial [Ginsengibacter sp.]